MNHEDRWTDLLSEYLDGELRPETRDALEAHLDACLSCTATLTELRRVSEAARALPVPPLHADLRSDLWQKIAPRLAPRRVPLGARLASALGSVRGRMSLTPPQFAAAALALVVGSAGITFFAVRLVALRGADTIAQRGDSTGAEVRTAGAGFDETRYAAAVADLERTLQTHRDELDPATVRALEVNLAHIDEALAESRQALIADPSNTYLNQHLGNQMRRKARVLQRAAMIVAATP